MSHQVSPDVDVRARRGRAAPAAVACVALLLAACGGEGSGDDGTPSVPGTSEDTVLPEGAERFDVPTWAWDRQSGMDALVTGRLSFTDDGCTLLYQEGAEIGHPVLFPNAEGIRFANGVRAVVDEESGEVFAIEGQEVSSGGGFLPVTTDWTDMCGEYPHGEVALINDLPTLGAPEEPEPLTGERPTTVGTLEQRGLYEVPHFVHSPGDGMDGALLEGTVRTTPDGCPWIEAADGRTGIVLPNAYGVRDAELGDLVYAQWDGTTMLSAEDGTESSFGGGFGDGDEEVREQWARLCPGTPVDQYFYGAPAW